MIRTSEMVSEGHPDKVADYLADSVLDYCLQRDPFSRVACEVLIKDNTVIFAGEITSQVEQIPLREIAEKAVKEIGFVGEYGLGNLHVVDLIGKQSPDIAQGVNKAADSNTLGAGDQGMMFGYATDETSELLPLPYVLARNILLKLEELRKTDDRHGFAEMLGPDAKSQVSIEYNPDGTASVAGVVVSTQHSRKFHVEQLREYVMKEAINPVLESKGVTLGAHPTGMGFAPVFINATGAFNIGGPIGDCGVTGRKIVVDSYGGFCPVGGGCFSGKDCTKVDRSAAYFARWVACKTLKMFDLKEVNIEVAYSIGVAKPVALNVRYQGSTSRCEEGHKSDRTDVECYVSSFDWTPAGIIKTLNLRRPIYSESCNYGHFTNFNSPWNQWNEAKKPSLDWDTGPGEP